MVIILEENFQKTWVIQFLIEEKIQRGYKNIVKKMERKKFLVICSILSIFKDHQKENRKVFKKYIQVF